MGEPKQSPTPIDPNRTDPTPIGPAPIDPTSCSIIGAVDALGDVWSILVLRELFLGIRRFNDIQEDLGISRSVLAARLARLVELGVVRTVPYQEPGDRVRQEYRPTRKGVGLLPLLLALKAWGDEHLNLGVETVRITERESGEDVRLEFRTPSGRQVQPNQLVAQQVTIAVAAETAASDDRARPTASTAGAKLTTA